MDILLILTTDSLTVSSVVLLSASLLPSCVRRALHITLPSSLPFANERVSYWFASNSTDISTDTHSEHKVEREILSPDTLYIERQEPRMDSRSDLKSSTTPKKGKNNKLTFSIDKIIHKGFETRDGDNNDCDDSSRTSPARTNLSPRQFTTNSARMCSTQTSDPDLNSMFNMIPPDPSSGINSILYKAYIQSLFSATQSPMHLEQFKFCNLLLNGTRSSPHQVSDLNLPSQHLSPFLTSLLPPRVPHPVHHDSFGHLAHLNSDFASRALQQQASLYNKIFKPQPIFATGSSNGLSEVPSAASDSTVLSADSRDQHPSSSTSSWTTNRDQDIVVDNNSCRESGVSTISSTSGLDNSSNNKAKLFKCSECHKVFNAHYNLTRHMPVHTGARPFVCKVCGKGRHRV